ncbi:MAG: DNA polymerase III subunit gamma/tau [Defluviitaleaceae bacterium]|nr:DNA polymerase III subunit gamma/tau [Defluviitaleaceae bacterium]
MSLYRKYRPKNFSQVFGQDHIVKTLLNQISTGSISHAYLFCGTRGTGKTSVARLLARALNCEDAQPNSIPCNKCRVCADILQNRSMNVIEIDAASNNGVDNIRDILEEVKYPPSTGTYKIYIIDEVHMLSTGAFNALLKTLEEPPDHVVFVLATTDPHKVLPTIHSRCQRFEFRRIPSADIALNIAPYLKQENVEIEPSALALISQLADGSVRDALSLADQAIAFYGNSTSITEENIRTLVGSVDIATLFEMTDALLQKNSLATIEIIHKMSLGSKDYIQFVNELIAHFRNLLVANIVKQSNQVLDVTKETLERLVNQGSQGSMSVFSDFIEHFTELLPKVRNEKNPKILLELACIKLCVREEIQKESPKERQKEPQKEPQKEKPNPNLSDSQVTEITRVAENVTDLNVSPWESFVQQQDSMLKALLVKCKFIQKDGFLQIQSDSDITYNILLTKEQEIKEKIARFTEQKIDVKITKEGEKLPQSGLSQTQQKEIQEKINMTIEFV